MAEIISDELIHSDIKTYHDNALSLYKQSLLKLPSTPIATLELIQTLFKLKVTAMESFSDIFKKHPDTFGNTEYLSWYNDAKRDIESKIDEMEEQKINSNNEASSTANRELLDNAYQTIQNKVNNNEYTSTNCDEYLKDYDKFLNAYNDESTGDTKLEALIEFLSEKKGEMIKNFVDNMEKENKEKITEMNMKLQKEKQNKQEAEDKYRDMNDKTEENSKKIDDLNSAIEKKKREIKRLNEEIEKIEQDIKREQNEYSSNTNNDYSKNDGDTD